MAWSEREPRGQQALGRRFVGDGGDAGEAVRLPQGEQVLGFGGEGTHPRRGLRLAAVDAVVVTPRADLRALRRVGGPHGRGQRGVEILGRAAYLGVRGVPGLRLPEPRLGLAGGVEEFRATAGQRQVGLVLLLRLTARLRPADGPRSHDPIAYADHAYSRNAGQARLHDVLSPVAR